MIHGLFSERMKLADVVLINHQLLYVLPYFDIGFGMGDTTVKQICEKKGISVPLFLLVCNVYSFDDYFPDANALTQIPLGDLMHYLKKSHKDYLEKRMPKIIMQILKLVDDCGVHNGEMLKEFCEKYRSEVITHFDYEEQTVFPYIESLLRNEKKQKYTIKEYKGNHSDLDAALNDLKNIILKYLPEDCPTEQCRDILMDLFLFESDLNKHTLLEDKILITLVEQIERNA